MKHYLIVCKTELQLHYILNPLLKRLSLDLSDVFELNNSTVILNCSCEFVTLKHIITELNNSKNDVFIQELERGNFYATKSIEDFFFYNSLQLPEVELNAKDKEELRNKVLEKINEQGIDSLTEEELKILQE